MSACLARETEERSLPMKFPPKRSPEFQAWQGTEDKPSAPAWGRVAVPAHQHYPAGLQLSSLTSCVPEYLRVVTSPCTHLHSEFRGQTARPSLLVLDTQVLKLQSAYESPRLKKKKFLWPTPSLLNRHFLRWSWGIYVLMWFLEFLDEN